jgi:hypothetical protein
MRNEMVIDQLILFHKPNKKVRNENKVDHFILQTKRTLKVVTADQAGIIVELEI